MKIVEHKMVVDRSGDSQRSPNVKIKVQNVKNSMKSPVKYTNAKLDLYLDKNVENNDIALGNHRYGGRRNLKQKNYQNKRDMYTLTTMDSRKNNESKKISG